MSEKITAIKNILLLTPISMCLGFFSSFLIPLYLGPKHFADFTVIKSSIFAGIMICEIGYNRGLANSLNECEETSSRYTLYNQIQSRRFIFSIIFTILICFLAPFLLNKGYLSLSSVSNYSFLLIGLIITFNLGSQLARISLTSTFRHKSAIIIDQLIILLRSACLIVSSIVFINSTSLLWILFILSIVEFIIFHFKAIAKFKTEKNLVPLNMINKSQLHGLVGLITKWGNNISNPMFLILFFSGIYSYDDISSLGIASDFIIRISQYSFIPLTNIISPVLYKIRSSSKKYACFLKDIVAITVLIISLIVTNLFLITPKIFDIAFGNTYNRSIIITLILVIPIFIESGVRLTFYESLFIQKKHSWISKYNILTIFIFSCLFYFMRNYSIELLLIVFGIVKILVSFIVVIKCVSLKLYKLEYLPIGIPIASIVALMASSYLLNIFPNPPIIEIIFSLILFYFVFYIIMRSFKLLPIEIYNSVLLVLPKQKKYIDLILKDTLPL